MKKRNLYTALLLSMLLCLFSTSLTAQAKTYRYVGSLLKYANSGCYINQVEYSKNKLTLSGNLHRYIGKSEKCDNNSISSKTFKITKKTKCYMVDYKLHKKSLKKILKTMKRYNGLFCVVYEKNGKVTEIRLCS